jgi:hypothetical protein
VLLVLDATPGMFEAHMEDNALEEGIHAPIKEQLLLLHTMGIKQVGRRSMGAQEECERTRGASWGLGGMRGDEGHCMGLGGMREDKE